MHLDELVGGHQAAGEIAVGAEGGDEGDQHDQPRIGHQPRHLRHPADVLHPVRLGEAEVLVEPVADIVPVKDVGVTAGRLKLQLDPVGQGRLARP